jgi:hypothetical protein
LFLDEVGEMSPRMQVVLLRFVESGEFQRVGSDHSQRVNVRLITATNRDLAVQIASGAFREDLYFRLNVIPLMMPPLRERREDILLGGVSCAPAARRTTRRRWRSRRPRRRPSPRIDGRERSRAEERHRARRAEAPGPSSIRAIFPPSQRHWRGSPSDSPSGGRRRSRRHGVAS